jgi:stearoyl-CoA desaturase (delta-9 desaturase)
MQIELDARPVVDVETKPSAARRSRSVHADADDDSAISRADRRLRIINLGAVLVPIAGLIVAMVLLWGTAFSWVYLALMTGMSLISGFGVTVGFHRLCTHKSFSTPAPLRYAFAAAGSMAVQGPVIEWCGAHRRHHQHSDTEGDPHSPHMGPDGSWGEGFIATLRGAYHAHVGWLFAGHQRGLGRYTRDLREDRAIAAANGHFLYWVLAGLVIPAVLGGVLTLSWMGVLLGFLWGGLVRILVIHHITWSVNSVCHLWGSRPFACGDESRNNPIVGILGLGEGWHNNHHAFPNSARHGLSWWQVDLSYMLIRVLALLGLARNIRLPDKDRMAAKRKRRHAAGRAQPAVSASSVASSAAASQL